jgi:hypothetical protein
VTRGAAVELYEAPRCLQNFIQRGFVEFRVLARVTRIAPRASQVTQAGADEDGGSADKPTFTLNRMEDFTDFLWVGGISG